MSSAGIVAGPLGEMMVNLEGSIWEGDVLEVVLAMFVLAYMGMICWVTYLNYLVLESKVIASRVPLKDATVNIQIFFSELKKVEAVGVGVAADEVKSNAEADNTFFVLDGYDEQLKNTNAESGLEDLRKVRNEILLNAIFSMCKVALVVLGGGKIFIKYLKGIGKESISSPPPNRV